MQMEMKKKGKIAVLISEKIGHGAVCLCPLTIDPPCDHCLRCHFCGSPVNICPLAAPQDCQGVLRHSRLLAVTSLLWPPLGSNLPEGPAEELLGSWVLYMHFLSHRDEIACYCDQNCDSEHLLSLSGRKIQVR